MHADGRPRIEVAVHRSADYERIVDEITRGHVVIASPIRSHFWSHIPAEYHRFIFRKEELTYQPENHERVHPHRLASHDEIQSLPRGTLPAIRSYDIMCRVCGFVVGDIIAIERPSGVYYRRVV